MSREVLELLTSAIFGLVIFFILMSVFFVKLGRSKKNIFVSEIPVEDKKTGAFVVVPRTLYFEGFNFIWSTSTFVLVFSIFMGLSKENPFEQMIYVSIYISAFITLMFGLLFYSLTIGRTIKYNQTEMIVTSIWKKKKQIAYQDIIDVIPHKQSIWLISKGDEITRIHILADGFRHFANVIYPFLSKQAAISLISNVYSVRPVTYYPNPNESVTCDLSAHKVIKLLEPDTLLEVKIKIPIDNEEVFEENGWVNNVVSAINTITDYSIAMKFICIGYTINLFNRFIHSYFYLSNVGSDVIIPQIIEEFIDAGIDEAAITHNVMPDSSHIAFYNLLPNDFHFEYMITSYKLEVLSKEIDLTDVRDLYFRFFFQNEEAYLSAIKDINRLGLTIMQASSYDVELPVKTYLGIEYHYQVIARKQMTLSMIELNAITDNIVSICKEHKGSFGLWAITLEDASELFDFEQNKRLI